MVIPREPRLNRGLRRDYTPTPQITKAYLLGVLHDATVRKTTYRVATKSREFAEIIKQGINTLGRNAWIYKEGKSRNLWIVEFSKSLLKKMRIISKQNKLDFINEVCKLRLLEVFLMLREELQKILKSDFIYIFVKRTKKFFYKLNGT